MFRATRQFFTSVALSLFALSVLAEGNSLLNVSYDVSRDFYKDYNPVFQRHWKTVSGESIELKQSHAGSSKQVRAVADGLEADVVTMNQASDVDFLAEKGLVARDYARKFPNNASPYTSTMVFIVRKGNPKALKDWGDLVRPGVQIILPHPKNTGNGRYTYLAAWGYALNQPGGNERAAQDFVGRLLKNAPLFAAGGRDATTTFMQRKMGDVLVSFESEAELIAREFGKGEFEVVYPSVSILSEFPVAIVDKVVDRKGTRKLAQAYLDYLWSPPGQETAAQNYLRPRNPETLKKYATQFPAIRTFTVDEVFGGWAKAFPAHFKDGGSFDQIYQQK
ncbi:MAG: sulfate ABC transporter substrate-binding protein [Candidatus Accumulibacter propinquus]|jgi:sulfate transport system substrate-binding protein|uniref:sulfate ABC transporter substrate-binding protein n=1 Tax=Candidatus Accumulibacter TaxID=327159 RepID=UPI001AC645C7|nr:sulfate ABC transporter substrate-binding protein [Accumulibacter sp.]MBK8385461.1 sulfate ABC transporter substrate-binding protein [Accumulibacter sp.]MBK8580127.1 sulfate ABC transporter substrate-binding protein [Candidatus Accumulibacter propinquus]MBN8437652.1 sulfate ABC transporter substrate-binding protein [Accumulibacter sp.]